MAWQRLKGDEREDFFSSLFLVLSFLKKIVKSGG